MRFDSFQESWIVKVYSIQTMIRQISAPNGPYRSHGLCTRKCIFF